jgi:hypothetical protein
VSMRFWFEKWMRQQSASGTSRSTGTAPSNGEQRKRDGASYAIAGSASLWDGHRLDRGARLSIWRARHWAGRQLCLSAAHSRFRFELSKEDKYDSISISFRETLVLAHYHAVRILCNGCTRPSVGLAVVKWQPRSFSTSYTTSLFRPMEGVWKWC